MVVHEGDCDRFISPSLRMTGAFEPWETELIRSEIRPGDVVLDVGANIGYYTLIFARLVGPAGKVYAFEPDPLNFALLKHNVTLNGFNNVTLINKAVSDHDGPGRLYVSETNSGDHRIYDSSDGRRSVPINSVSLDSYFSRIPTKIDFIKFDIQGAEWSALQGMKAIIRRQTRIKMIAEFWPYGLSRYGVAPSEFLSFLVKSDFRLFDIDEPRGRLSAANVDDLLRRFDPQREDFTNLLCVKTGRHEPDCRLSMVTKLLRNIRRTSRPFRRRLGI